MRTFILVLVVLCAIAALGHSGTGALTSLVALAVTIFGLVRCFQASIILGIVAFLISPLALIVGVVSLITQRNFGDDIVALFRS